MGFQRYKDCVLNHKGHALYESEVHPSVVSEVMGMKISGRSYFMPAPVYAQWMEKTGMDMMYVYTPWPVGRQEYIDKYGVIRWNNGFFTASDLRKDPPYETIKRRLDSVCKEKKDWGIEAAVYSAPMLLADGFDLEKLSMLYYDDPDLLDSYLKALTEKVSLELEIILEYPVDAVQISQILGEKNGPICNDEHMERFHLKYLRQHVQHIRARGKIATLHCDGKLDKLYSRLMGVGVQCINGYDSSKFDTDLQEWGDKIAMRGCIPMAEIHKMNALEIRMAVQRAKKKPAHVIGSTHDWPIDCPVQFRAMIEEFSH